MKIDKKYKGAFYAVIRGALLMVAMAGAIGSLWVAEMVCQMMGV